VFDALRNRLREKLRRREDNSHRDDLEKSDFFRSRPKGARPRSSPTMTVLRGKGERSLGKQRPYERLRRGAEVPIREPTGEQRSLQASSDMEILGSRTLGLPLSLQSLRGAGSTEGRVTRRMGTLVTAARKAMDLSARILRSLSYTDYVT